MMMSMEGYHLAAFNGLRLPPPHPPTCLGKGYGVSSQSVTFRMSGPSGGRNLFTDQAFHTPSFGDEDFDLPPLTLPSEQGSGYTGGRASLALPGSLQPDLHPDHAHAAFQPKFPPQNFDVPDITVSNSLSSSMYSGEEGLMTSDQTPLSTISQSQMARQLGFQTAVGGTSPPTSTSSPSRESSEDSDDSLPLAQLVSLKRPASNVSPVPSPDHGLAVPQTSSAAKKPKTPKKKKKKDPNEPQKPVSAYALFFRDTQAVIKGQNPNASFGDVSKIVASMWDSLDPENKNVYKKKTEVAKKEYLKQLAAYRASQVSQSGGGGEEGSSPSDKSPSPQSDASPSPQASSPLSHPPPATAMHVQAPLGHPQGGMGGYGAHPGGLGHLAMMPGQPGGMGVPAVPPHNNSLPFQQPLSQARGEHMLEAGVTASGLCVRAGCSNNAVDNPGWDSEYCSNDCVVRHCRDVFTAWVATRQGASDGFPVK